MKLYCNKCKELQPVRIQKEKRTYTTGTYKIHFVKAEFEITYCGVCSSEVYNREAEIRNDEIFREAKENKND